MLLCIADGSPRPVYGWTKDELPMPTVPDAAVTTGLLKIQNVELADAGVYRCIASNRLGAIRSQPAQVHVACEYIHFSFGIF